MAPPAAERQKPPALPAATVTSEALARLQRAHAEVLADVLMWHEGALVLDDEVLKSIGSGTAAGLRLIDCTSAEEIGKHRDAVAIRLLWRDRRLLKLVPKDLGYAKEERKRLLMLAVGRMVLAIMDTFKMGAGAVVAVPGGGMVHGTTVYTIAAKEGEMNYALPAYSTKEVKSQMELVGLMYSLRLRTHALPTAGVFKKLAYWITDQGCWPSSEFVTLESFRREAYDSQYTLFLRLLNGCLVVAAGMEVPKTARDDGQGQVPGQPDQWLSGLQIIDLLQEVESVRDRLTDAELGGVTRAMHEQMHKSTSVGGVSGSFAAHGQISDLTKYVNTQLQIATASGKKGGGSPRTPRAEKKRGRVPSSPIPTVAGEEEEGKKTYKDEVGELGPNGLPRMKGGNPKGDACGKLKKTGKCPYESCSYSHAKRK